VRVKPDFLLIGAAKCGTTSLCALLAQHPDVFLHPKKELNFFSHDAVFAKGLDWYERQFAAGHGRRAVGEGSPNYAKRARHPLAAERIARALPDARLLYIARHPLRRMESAWLHARRAGHRSERSFTATVRRYPEYVDTSDYGAQLAVYLQHFRAERILVLFFEDFRADPRAVLRRAFAFLGVDPDFAVQDADAVRNPSLGQPVDVAWRRKLARVPLLRWTGGAIDERPQWDDATRAWVRERLEEPTSRFLEAHGKPTDWWDWSE
jgi:hypothetical protein